MKRGRGNNSKGHSKHKKLKGVQKLPPLPQVDDDYDVTEEDFQLVDQFKEHIGFLKNLSQKQLDKSVMEPAVDKGPQIDRTLYQYGQKRKKNNTEEDDEEDAEDYERVPRKELKEADSGAKASLPIKQLDGKIVKQDENEMVHAQVEELEPVPGVNVVDEWANAKIYQDNISSTKKQTSQKQSTQKKERKASKDASNKSKEAEQKQSDQLPDQQHETKEEKYDRLKMRIAVGCMRLMENPEENMVDLSPVIEILKDDDDRIVALCMLSLLNVFCNIIPGYRIRPPTEQELQTKMKKEVMKVRDYEDKLLSNYQKYLKQLLRYSNKSGPVQEVAVRCLCSLLDKVPHFNYTQDVLQAIVRKMEGKNAQIRSQCCNAVSEILERDVLGEIGLAVVQLIADVIKRQKCKCAPEIVNCLLVLKFREVRPPSEQLPDNNQKQKKKKRKKRKRKDDEVALAFKESAAEIDKDEAEMLQSQTLEALFEIVFRVLKDCASEIGEKKLASQQGGRQRFPLMTPALQALSQYGHLLSIEYMSDLVNVCADIMKSEGLITIDEKCYCLSSLCDLLSGHGEALAVDRGGVYQQIYNIMNEIVILPLFEDDEEIGRAVEYPARFDVFIKVLHFLLCDTKQTDLNRLAAFVKRSGGCAMHGELKETMGSLSLIYKLLVKYYKLRRLMEFEGQDSGQFPYNQDAEDPGQANALSSTLWEIFILTNHFNPTVANCAKWLIQQFQDANKQTRSSILSGIAGPVELVKQTDDMRNIFENAAQNPPNPSINRNKRKNVAMNSAFRALQVGADNLCQDLNVEQLFTSHFNQRQTRR